MTTARPNSELDTRTPDADAPPALQARLLHPTTAMFATAAALFAVLNLAHVQVPYAVQVIPFAVSVLLFGLPHGALDHLVPARMDPRIGLRRSVTSVVLLYAALGSVTAALWIALPAVGFATFIAVTWFHWGQGDLWLDRVLHRTEPDRLDGALTILIRGALPMLLPLITHPTDYDTVYRITTRLLEPAGVHRTSLPETADLRIAAIALLAGLIGAHLAVRLHLRKTIRHPVIEIAVLAAFFTTVPPILAIGLYFTFWHAIRHIIRLELLDPASRKALKQGRLLHPFLHFLHDALPVTLCAVALLAGLALLLHDTGLGTYLLFIAALTTPHTAVVTWMDHQRTVRRCPPLVLDNRAL